MFTPGRERAFNCLIYMHRYDKTTLSRMRIDYLLKHKKVLQQSINYIKLGDETEAIDYVQRNIHLWKDAGELFKRFD